MYGGGREFGFWLFPILILSYATHLKLHDAPNVGCNIGPNVWAKKVFQTFFNMYANAADLELETAAVMVKFRLARFVLTNIKIIHGDGG